MFYVPPQDRFPAAFDVSDMFGLEVLSSIDGQPDESNKNCFALGCYPEPAAGLRGCQVTPYFASMAELEAFCRKHLELFRRLNEETEEIPDATGWDI
jgi:hypothetical protein